MLADIQNSFYLVLHYCEIKSEYDISVVSVWEHETEKVSKDIDANCK